MPEDTFLPYRFRTEALDIRVTSLKLDDEEKDPAEFVDAERATVAMAGVAGWEELSLGIEVTDPSEQLPEVVLEGEKPAQALDLYLVVRGSEGRQRDACRLEHGDGVWRGVVAVKLGGHRGSISLGAVAVRASGGPEDAVHAFRRGERVADSIPWTLYLDDRAPMPGGAIDGKWRDFPSDPIKELRDRADCAWYLDLTHPDSPQLFLNEAVKGLKKALDAPQRHGRAARVRDALSHSILQPVLTTMAVEAIAGAEDTHIESLTGWRRKALVHLARHCDDGTEETVVERWLSAWKSDDRAGVMADLATCIQRHLSVAKAAKYLVDALEEDD